MPQALRRLQNNTELTLNAHDKTKVSMLISVWTNPIASFIFVEGSMAQQTQEKHA